MLGRRGDARTGVAEMKPDVATAVVLVGAVGTRPVDAAVARPVVAGARTLGAAWFELEGEAEANWTGTAERMLTCAALVDDVGSAALVGAGVLYVEEDGDWWSACEPALSSSSSSMSRRFLESVEAAGRSDGVRGRSSKCAWAVC